MPIVRVSVHASLDGVPLPYFPLVSRLDLSTLSTPAVQLIDETVGTTSMDTSTGGGELLLADVHSFLLHPITDSLTVDVDASQTDPIVMPGGVLAVTNTRMNSNVGYRATNSSTRVRGFMGGAARFS